MFENDIIKQYGLFWDFVFYKDTGNELAPRAMLSLNSPFILPKRQNHFRTRLLAEISLLKI